jgi:hypothetical protein
MQIQGKAVARFDAKKETFFRLINKAINLCAMIRYAAPKMLRADSGEAYGYLHKIILIEERCIISFSIIEPLHSFFWLFTFRRWPFFRRPACADMSYWFTYHHHRLCHNQLFLSIFSFENINTMSLFSLSHNNGL